MANTDIVEDPEKLPKIHQPNFLWDSATVILPPSTPEILGAGVKFGTGGIVKAAGGALQALGDVSRSDTITEAGEVVSRKGQELQITSVQPGETVAQAYLRQAVGMTTQMTPVIAGGAMFGPLAALLGVGGVSGFSTYSEAKEEGLSGGMAATTSAIDAGIEIATSLLPIKYLFGAAGMPVRQRILRGLAAEYGGEVSASILQNMNAMAFYKPDMTVDDVIKDAIDTGIITTIASPMMLGVGSLANGLRRHTGSGALANIPLVIPPLADPPVPNIALAQEGANAALPGDTVGGVMGQEVGTTGDLVAPPRAPGAAPAATEPTLTPGSIPNTPQDGLTPITPQTEQLVAQQTANEPFITPTPAPSVTQQQFVPAAETLDYDTKLSEWIKYHRSITGTTSDAAAIAEAPPNLRPVLMSTNQAQVGQTVDQVWNIRGGDVLVVGPEFTGHTVGILKQYFNEAKFAAENFLKNKVAIVITTGAAGNANATAQMRVAVDGSPVVFITPPMFQQSALEIMKATDDVAVSRHSQAVAQYSFYHELGHALRDFVAKTAPKSVQRKLAESYAESVMDFEMPAAAFVSKWMSPWKVARGFGLDAYGGKTGEWRPLSAERFVQMVMSRDDGGIGKSTDHITARSLLFSLGRRVHGGQNWDKIWSFDEFMAEQHSRWMRDKGNAKTGPMGRFFSNMNALMDRYYAWLEKSQLLPKEYSGAQVSYEKFMEWLSKQPIAQKPPIVTKKLADHFLKQKNGGYRYDINPDADPSAQSELAGVSTELSLDPKVQALAHGFAKRYKTEKSPFFLSWGGHWMATKLSKHVLMTQYLKSDKLIAMHRSMVERERHQLIGSLDEQWAQVKRYGLQKKLQDMFDKVRADITQAEAGELYSIELVTDARGEPKLFYHGTRANFAAFDFGKLGSNASTVVPGFFLSDNPLVSETYTLFAPGNKITYAMPVQNPGSMYPFHSGAAIIPMYVALRKPAVVDFTGLSTDINDTQARLDKAMREAVHTNGNGVIATNIYDPMSVETGPSVEDYTSTIVVFLEPQSVKSKFNVTFSPSKPEIHLDAGDNIAQADEEPIRNIGNAVPDFPTEDLLRAATKIRHKWWLSEKLRHLTGIDVGTVEPNMLQWQHFAQRVRELPFVQRFVDLSRSFTETKNLSIKFASELTVKGYKQLGHRQLTQLKALMEKETELGEHWTTVIDGNLPDGRPAKLRIVENKPEFKRRIQKELGFTPDDLTLHYFEGMRTSMHNQLLELRNSAVARISDSTVLQLDERYGEFASLMVDANSEDVVRLDTLLNTPQYPWSRFGKYALIVEQRKVNDKGKAVWEPVYYRHFESAVDRGKALQKFKRTDAERAVTHDYHDDHIGFSVIPASFVETVIKRAGFDANSVDADMLRKLAAVQRNANIFKRFDPAFTQVDRGQHDVLKDFADFSGHMGALSAKVQFRRQFAGTVADARKAKAQLSDMGAVQQADMDTLVHYMDQQIKYGFSPQDEMQNLRAVITKALLMGNARAALVNATSVLNTAAHLDGLISKYNILKWPAMLKLFTTTAKDLVAFSRNYKGLPPDEIDFITRTENEGVYDQSQSYHLAAIADSGVFQRLTRGRSRLTTQISETGMAPFRIMERITRRLGGLLAYRMAKQYPSITGGLTAEQFAKDTVYLTQGDYSAMNRPRSQQGRRAAALIFMTYTQSMVSMMGGTLGAQTAMRLWLIYLALGGMLGAPFAEDILNVANWVWRRVFHGKEDLRVAAQRAANEIPFIGTALLRGVAHNIGGFDLSHSVSLGRIVPGLDSFGRSNMQPVDEAFGSFAFDLLGPLGGYMRGLLQSGGAFITEPSMQASVKLGQAILPAQRSALDLALYHLQGDISEVRGYAGHIITRDSDGSIRPLDSIEITGKAMGFNPRIVAVNREIDFLQKEVATYWNHRRKRLMDAVWQAQVTKNPDMLLDAKDAIADFNADAPDAALKISNADLKKSRDQHARIKKLEEQGKAPTKRYMHLYTEIEDAVLGR